MINTEKDFQSRLFSCLHFHGSVWFRFAGLLASFVPMVILLPPLLKLKTF